MIPRASVLILCLFATSCGAGLPDETAPNRCFEGINLHQLIAAENSPQLAQSGYGTSGMNLGIENRLFDDTQVADLPGEVPPAPFGAHLCERLRDQLAQRCTVKEMWIGTESCAGAFESEAVTGPDGVYKRRPVMGRATLVVARAQDGRPKVVLTTTEWKN